MQQGTTGWKATIGWIKAGAVDKTVQDCFRMTPPDVNVAICTTMWTLKMVIAESFDAERFVGLRENLVAAARDLIRYQDPDVIAATGDLIQVALGVRWNQELREAIQEATGKPATTSMTAVTDALAHLGARRVAVGTPYREEHRALVRAYLEAAGFEVTAIDGHATQDVHDIRALPEQAPLEMGKKVVQAAEGAQAIYLACPVWAADRCIVRLEQACDVPVVTVLNAMVWRTLTAIRYPTGVKGYGRLLERV